MMTTYKLNNGRFYCLSAGAYPYFFREMQDTMLVTVGGSNPEIISECNGYVRDGESAPRLFGGASGLPWRIPVCYAYAHIMHKGWDNPAPNPKAVLGFDEAGNLTAYSEELKQEPKCDCGGAKCNLPCVSWCSTQNKR